MRGITTWLVQVPVLVIPFSIFQLVEELDQVEELDEVEGQAQVEELDQVEVLNPGEGPGTGAEAGKFNSLLIYLAKFGSSFCPLLRYSPVSVRILRNPIIKEKTMGYGYITFGNQTDLKHADEVSS